MPRIDVQVPTSDGVSTATLHVPDGEGPWPGVLLFTDIFGRRPVMDEFGDRLAGLGYVALIPDLYYREGGFAPFDTLTAFGDEAERNRLFALAGTLTNERIIADAGSYADFLLARPEVRGSAIGTQGYCMGGRLALVAAGGIGDKLAALGSFHAAGVAVPDDPNSPHLAADKIKATVFVAGASNDHGFTAEHAALLDSALAAAGVPHTVETWPGGHGFTVSDMPSVYDAALEQRHWDALRDLYAGALA
jgi:carboxymethylenebutenolidase